MNTEGEGWLETCTGWRDGRSFTFEIDTSDYSYPLSRMTATWSADPVGNGSLIRMRFAYEPDDTNEGRRFNHQLTALFPAVLTEILDRWQDQAQQLAREES